MQGRFRKKAIWTFLYALTIPRVLSVLAVLCVGCAARPRPACVTVLTYNIYHGEDANGRSNLDAVARIITTLQPDLVALQEVDDKTTRVKGLDLTAELSQRTGMSGRFGKAMDFAGGGYGEAVLSRFPILTTTTHLLPHTSGAEPRAALEIEVRLPDGRRMLFVGTHFDHQRDPENRMAQAARIIDLYADSELPVILAGDLNATPDSDVIALFLEEWSYAGRYDPQPTFPADNPKIKIDYIMMKPPGRWRVVETRVIDESIASDHRPVLSILEMEPSNRSF